MFIRLMAFVISIFCAASLFAEPVPFGPELGDPLPPLNVESGTSSEARATVLLLVDPDSEVSRQMLPEFENFVWAKLKDEGLEAIVFVRDASPAEAKAFAEEMNLTFAAAPDPDREYAGWFADGGKGVPRLIVADEDREIVYMHAGYSVAREAEFYDVIRSVIEGEPVGRYASGTGSGGASDLGAVDLRGGEAPELEVEKWITGEPGDLAGKFVMTEFWATWCGPCIASMPHLQELSEKYEDKLIIRSISNEEPEVVSRFVREQGFTYPIGVDTQARTITDLQIRGIPHGYIQNPEGIVVWQGHPAMLEFDLMDKILSGEYQAKP